MAGFWRIDPITWDEIHISGDPEMSDEKLAALEAACNQLFAEELQRKPESAPKWGCPFDEPLDGLKSH